jgi:hypothetical protein
MTDSTPSPQGPHEAHVSTLTAEVKSLMVGSRQVTLSVYGQLDCVTDKEIDPMGRVTPKGDDNHVYVFVVGRLKNGGALARSWLPKTEHAIKRDVSQRSSAGAFESQAERHEAAAADRDQAADKCDQKAEDLRGSGYGGIAYYEKQAADHGAEAFQADQGAKASDGIDRLTALRDAAQSRRNAAEARLSAAKAEAKAEDLEQEAAARREEAETFRRRAAETWTAANKWAAWEDSEVQRVTAVAKEWCDLPLIVLAGLR